MQETDTVSASGRRRQTDKEYAMKDYIEEGLALAGMIAVLLGIMFVAAATLA